MEQTLVLDCSYTPIARTTWQTAIVQVIKIAAEVVDEYPDRYIRTPSWQVKMPSVIRLLRPVKRNRAIKFSRQSVWARDEGRCQYCSRRVPRGEATYDHVVPRAQGGKTVWDNVVIACVPCNQRKGGMTPAQARMVLRVEPCRPKKLPDVPDPSLMYRDGMPSSWRNWLRDAVYWNGTLEE